MPAANAVLKEMKKIRMSLYVGQPWRLAITGEGIAPPLPLHEV